MRSPIFGARIRAIASVAPPGGKGTMRRTGRAGYGASAASAHVAASDRTSTAHQTLNSLLRCSMDDVAAVDHDVLALEKRRARRREIEGDVRDLVRLAEASR